MSNRTYVCSVCGEVRRQPAIYFDQAGEPSRPTPRCHEAEMVSLEKGYAEAASKLDAPGRVTWLQAGGLIVQEPGRRWKAAITAREIERARDQLARHLASQSPAI
jgi:hypothetical protein